MKKSISIFLLFCIVAPITGTYIWLNYEKNIIRNEVKEQMIAGIDNRNLVLLNFKKSEIDAKISWEEPKEFEYNGQMYDVVETTIEKDSIFYRCWWDNDETILNKRLANLVSDVLKNHQQSKENNERLIQFYKVLYLADVPRFKFKKLTSEEIQYIENSEVYCSYSSDPLVPPPRFLGNLNFLFNAVLG